MSGYRKNHVKRNSITGEIAVRTSFDDEDPATADRAWTLSGGDRPAGTGRASTPTVDAAPWYDLFTPPEPEE